MFFKIGVTGKHLCWNLFFNKVAGLRRFNVYKTSIRRLFSCEFSQNTPGGCFCQGLKDASASGKNWLNHRKSQGIFWKILTKEFIFTEVAGSVAICSVTLLWMNSAVGTYNNVTDTLDKMLSVPHQNSDENYIERHFLLFRAMHSSLLLL